MREIGNAAEKKMDYNGRLIRAIVLPVITVVLTLLLTSITLSFRDARIYPSNISVGGVELAGLTQKEAVNLLNQKLPASWGNELLIYSPVYTISIPLEKAGIFYDISATMAQLDELLQPQGLAGVFKHSIIRGSEVNINPRLQYNRTLLKQQLEDIKRTYDLPPVNARIIHKNDYVDYISHKNGYAINVAASMDKICATLDQGSLGPVALIVNETYPQIKIDDLFKAPTLSNIGK